MTLIEKRRSILAELHFNSILCTFLVEKSGDDSYRSQQNFEKLLRSYKFPKWRTHFGIIFCNVNGWNRKKTKDHSNYLAGFDCVVLQDGLYERRNDCGSSGSLKVAFSLDSQWQWQWKT